MRESDLGGEQVWTDRGNENRIVKCIYIYILSNSRQIEVSRGVEPSVEKNNANRCNYQGGVEKHKKSSIDPPTIEKLSRERSREMRTGSRWTFI